MADIMKDYVDVAERIRIFKELYPNGSLQPANLEKPFEIVVIGDRTFIVYVSAAYRNPDDVRPGIGVAWEPFPGKTTFTRDSELMVCETSSWGRAIVATLAADTKRIASADEVRNRPQEQPKAPKRVVKAEQPVSPASDAKNESDDSEKPSKWTPPKTQVDAPKPKEASIARIVELATEAGITTREEMRDYCSMVLEREIVNALSLTPEDMAKVVVALKKFISEQNQE